MRRLHPESTDPMFNDKSTFLEHKSQTMSDECEIECFKQVACPLHTPALYSTAMNTDYVRLDTPNFFFSINQLLYVLWLQWGWVAVIEAFFYFFKAVVLL